MKKFLLCTLLFAALTPLFAKSYSIGDIGPGGGIVFYKSAEGFEVDDGMGDVQVCHYLEVSPEDLGATTWIPSEASFLEDLDNIYGIGAGKANTFLIANAGLCPEDLTKENCAAYMCSIYSTKTTSPGDWYLPSSDELKLVFKNLTADGNNIRVSYDKIEQTYADPDDPDSAADAGEKKIGEGELTVVALGSGTAKIESSESRLNGVQMFKAQ